MERPFLFASTPMRDPNTVLIPIKKANPARIINHYTLIHKMGFPQGVKCWCGQALTFTVHERGMQKKRKAFFDQHDECDAPKERK